MAGRGDRVLLVVVMVVGCEEDGTIMVAASCGASTARRGRRSMLPKPLTFVPSVAAAVRRARARAYGEDESVDTLHHARIISMRMVDGQGPLALTAQRDEREHRIAPRVILHATLDSGGLGILLSGRRSARHLPRRCWSRAVQTLSTRPRHHRRQRHQLVPARRHGARSGSVGRGERVRRERW